MHEVEARLICSILFSVPALGGRGSQIVDRWYAKHRTPSREEGSAYAGCVATGNLRRFRNIFPSLGGTDKASCSSGRPPLQQ